LIGYTIHKENVLEENVYTNVFTTFIKKILLCLICDSIKTIKLLALDFYEGKDSCSSFFKVISASVGKKGEVDLSYILTVPWP
jgi:hypothetical protein